MDSLTRAFKRERVGVRELQASKVGDLRYFSSPGRQTEAPVEWFERGAIAENRLPLQARSIVIHAAPALGEMGGRGCAAAVAMAEFENRIPGMIGRHDRHRERGSDGGLRVGSAMRAQELAGFRHV